MGLSNKAYAVRTDPRLIFKRTYQRRVVPTMEQFTSCSTVDDLQNLVLQETNTQFVWSATVLPPYLSKDILALDDWKAETILIHVLQAIHHQRTPTHQHQIPNNESNDTANENQPDGDDTGPGDDTNANDDDTIGEQNNNEAINNQAEPIQMRERIEAESKLYYETLKFLWATAFEPDMLPGIPLPVCTKTKMIHWLDQLHTQYLQQNRTILVTTPAIPPTHNTNLASSLTQLANALASKNLHANIVDTNDIPDKENKKINRLPTANKNILLLFQLQDGQGENDVEMLEPNINILTMVNQTSPIAIQTLLHLECARLGLMATFPLSLCTALKNGCLTSSPRPSSLNNLCIFLCPPEGEGQSLLQYPNLCSG